MTVLSKKMDILVTKLEGKISRVEKITTPTKISWLTPNSAALIVLLIGFAEFDQIIRLHRMMGMQFGTHST